MTSTSLPSDTAKSLTVYDNIAFILSLSPSLPLSDLKLVSRLLLLKPQVLVTTVRTSFMTWPFGDEAIELKLEDVSESNLGEAAEIIITKDDTLIMKGKPLIISHLITKELTIPSS